MEIQQNRFVKVNGIKTLGTIFFSSLFFSTSAISGMPVFGIVPVDRPLAIHTLVPQGGKANDSFNFNLRPFISTIQPEVDYRVTNNLGRTLTDIEIVQLPQGVTRVYEGDGVCQQVFTLDPSASCVLRFVVDKNRFVPPPNGGPIVCYRPPNGYCYRPGVGAQFNDTVPHLPGSTQAIVTPVSQDGLEFDPATFTISGRPSRQGIFLFNISATNGYTTASPRELIVNVEIDPRDKPVFKVSHSIASAMANKHYRLNLMDLLEPTPGFMVSNQVVFKIDEKKPYPGWLSIDKDNATVLQGQASIDDAGKTKEVTLIATSNTGGDSNPLTIQIPVAFDPTLKPLIEKGIELRGEAGFEFKYNLRPNITDPVNDSRLKIIVDKIHPAASWLTASESDSTELTGMVPPHAVGQIYQITLHANTTIGGDSEPVTVPLQITIDKTKTPTFYSAKPVLPLLYAGQPYFYDFAASNDITPEYSDIPFTIELAEGHRNPYWVRIEDNKLIIDKVPEKLKQRQQIFITIKNVPGGKSEVWALDLFVMG